MKDYEVKERLESLSPLAGGVVFGKEEAWDKLQARMEKKPASKIPMLHLSAAAILLLGIGISTYKYLQAPTVENMTGIPATSTTPQTTGEQTVINTPETQTPLSVSPETVRMIKTTIPVRNNKTLPVIEKSETEVATTNVTTAPLPTVVNEPVKPTPVHKMRVVHINDIGKTEEETQPVYVYNGPALDISKMKVVSLNDVQREESMRKQEEEIITMIRINRPHGSFFGFTNAVSFGGAISPLNNKNPLSIRLNRNN